MRSWRFITLAAALFALAAAVPATAQETRGSIEGVVKAYPNGMSSQDIQDVTSDGHRAMVKAFTTGIDKLPK